MRAMDAVRAAASGLGWRLKRSGLRSLGSLGAAVFLSAGLAWGSSVEAQAASVATAPTWTALYGRYLAAGTVGDCASCHTEAASAQSAYAWLANQQYMAGSGPYLNDPRASCLSWLGGDMPPDGPTKYTRATRDFAAWASAGMHDD